MSAKNATTSVVSTTTNKVDIARLIAEAIEHVETAAKASQRLGKEILEIQKKIALIVHSSWDLNPVSSIIQKMLDTPCLRAHGKRLLANLDFIIGYYADAKIQDNGTLLIKPCDDPARLVEAIFIEQCLILKWVISPRKIGEAMHGRHKQAAFYAACTKRAEVVNRYPCSKIKLDLGTPEESASKRELKALAKRLQSLAKRHATLCQDQEFVTLDLILTQAKDLGLIKYESHKPQDQRNLANTASHDGSPIIPTK